MTAFGIGEFSQIQPFIKQSGTASRLQLFFGEAAESITINNILPSQLSAADFIFSTSTTGITYGTTGFLDLILGSLGPDTIDGGGGDRQFVG